MTQDFHCSNLQRRGPCIVCSSFFTFFSVCIVCRIKYKLVVVPSMGIKPTHLDSTGHDLSYAVIHVVDFLCKNPRLPRKAARIRLIVHMQTILYFFKMFAWICRTCLPQLGKQQGEFCLLLFQFCRVLCSIRLYSSVGK